MPIGSEFERLVSIMARLRAPDGCPWDRKQTFDSIRAHTLEETYEVIEAIDDRNWPALRDELGDLLLQVIFYSRMAEEQRLFTTEEVVNHLAGKLVRRHPHVFEDETGKRMNAEQALGRWNAMKAEEKLQGGQSDATTPNATKASLLGEVTRGLPAMLEAYKISVRAAGAGFEWPDAEAVLDKLEEEIGELRQELRSANTTPAVTPQPGDSHTRLEDEIGDMFFTVVNIARHLGLEPESALKRANRKFCQRFERMEALLHSRGGEFKAMSPAELDAVWEEVKQEASAGQPITSRE
jgi:XTP/dITP diphosphohydrolase/ATP diphosphatase